MDYLKNVLLGILFLFHVLFLIITSQVFINSTEKYVLDEHPLSVVASSIGLFVLIYLSFLFIRSIFRKEFIFYINRIILFVPFFFISLSFAMTENIYAYHSHHDFFHQSQFELASRMMFASCLALFVTIPVWWTHRKKHCLYNFFSNSIINIESNSIFFGSYFNLSFFYFKCC